MKPRVRYQARSFRPENIVKRYAALDGTLFVIFDVNANGYTIRETWVDRFAIPEPVAVECERLQGQAFNQTELPK